MTKAYELIGCTDGRSDHDQTNDDAYAATPAPADLIPSTSSPSAHAQNKLLLPRSHTATPAFPARNDDGRLPASSRRA